MVVANSEIISSKRAGCTTRTNTRSWPS